MRDAKRRTWLCLTAAVLLLVGGRAETARAQATAAVGDCDPPNVQVRGKVSMRNKTGEDANDFHFYMYQNDRPGVVVTGAQVSAAGCTGAAVALDTDDGGPNPPPGNHGAHVDVDGCNIPAGEAITVEVVLCMNERNVVKIKDAEFTKDGVSLPHPKPPPNGGWRVGRPFRGGNGGNRAPGGGGQGAQEGDGGNGNWIHLVYVENDDSRWVVLDEIKLLASTTYYADIEDIDWDSIAPIVDANGEPPVCIAPWDRYCYPFQTKGSYLGGHVYMKYKVRVADPGECGVVVLSGMQNDNGDDDDDDTVEMFGDHPVEALLTEVLEGMDFYVTTEPTSIDFGGAIPPVPADFFNPGSEPFVGRVELTGQPLAPTQGDADTIIRRLGEAYLPEEGSLATVPIELVALNLVSIEPILVTTPPSTSQNLFDVLPGFQTTDNFLLPPTRTGVSGDGGVSVDTEIIEMSLTQTAPAGLLLRGEAGDSGGPPELFGHVLFMDVYWDPSLTMPIFPVDSFFDVFFDIQLPEGGHLPMPPPTLLHSDSFFDVHFEVHMPSPSGEKVVQHQVHGNINPDQPLRFVEVGTGPHSGMSFFDLFLMLEATGPIDPTLPLLRVTTQATTTVFGVDSFFDVSYTLEPGFITSGTMDIVRDSAQGGTFTSTLQMLPRITFVPIDGGPELTMPDLLPIEVQQPLPHPWSFSPPVAPPSASGPNFFPSSASPLQWVAVDGTPHTVNPASGPPCPVPFDFHGDGDVDFDDLELFMACATGPGLLYNAEDPPPGCTLLPDAFGIIPADADRDGDVDMADFAAFQRCYSGEGNPIDLNCACK